MKKIAMSKNVVKKARKEKKKKNNCKTYDAYKTITGKSILNGITGI